jgi:hypothetical protein
VSHYLCVYMSRIVSRTKVLFLHGFSTCLYYYCFVKSLGIVIRKVSGFSFLWGVSRWKESVLELRNEIGQHRGLLLLVRLNIKSKVVVFLFWIGISRVCVVFIELDKQLLVSLMLVLPHHIVVQVVQDIVCNICSLKNIIYRKHIFPLLFLKNVKQCPHNDIKREYNKTF